MATLAAMSLAAPILLSLDTATERIHAALSVGEAAHVWTAEGGARASASLLPGLTALLTQAGLVWADVQALGLGCGPGAFTGLRTACSVVQGLALGLDKPVLVLDTLMAVAEDARLRAPEDWSAGDTLWVLQDARMDELYVGAFAWTGRRWQVTQVPQLWSLGEPAQRWVHGDPGAAAPSDPVRLAGSALLAYPERFAALLAQGAWTDALAVPSGLALAALAQQAWADGAQVDAALALPRYVRDKVAQTTAERAAQRGATAAA